MRVLLSLISIIFLTGCATNLPYVDTFDVKELEGGMSTTEVKNILGKPIKVHSTEQGLIWEYKFRTLSNPRMSWEPPKKGDSPSIIGDESELYCTFQNERLMEWGSCINGCDNNASEDKSSNSDDDKPMKVEIKIMNDRSEPIVTKIVE